MSSEIEPCEYCLDQTKYQYVYKRSLCCVARAIVGTPMRLRVKPMQALKDELDTDTWDAFCRYYIRVRDGTIKAS